MNPLEKPTPSENDVWIERKIGKRWIFDGKRWIPAEKASDVQKMFLVLWRRLGI